MSGLIRARDDSLARFFPGEGNPPAGFRLAAPRGPVRHRGQCATVMAVTVAPSSIVHLRLRTDRPAASAAASQQPAQRASAVPRRRSSVEACVAESLARLTSRLRVIENVLAAADGRGCPLGATRAELHLARAVVLSRLSLFTQDERSPRL